MDDVNKNMDNTSEVLEIMSSSSLYDFMQNETLCYKEETSENCDVDSIFDEISRLTSLNDKKYQCEDENRTIEEIIKEVETLINQPLVVSSNNKLSTISGESTPFEIKNNILDQYDYSTTTTLHDDDTSDRTLLNDQLDTLDSCPSSPDTVSSMKSKKSSKSSGSKKSAKSGKESMKKSGDLGVVESAQIINEPELVAEENNEDDGIQFEFDEFVKAKLLCEQLRSNSPTHSVVSSTSYSNNWSKELEKTNEKLLDTEERFQSLKLQYESLSQAHRVLRENHLQLQEETDKLKIDHQILTECANVLRCELQGARKDHEASVEIQKILQRDLEENRVDKKKFHDITERDSKIIQDLQRQCKEMERILMRKHPDSVSALIVASNSFPSQDTTSASTRKLLEERIAQLEADAKEQDKKAQGILASVQARFMSVQAKYETHIQDLETQVLSIQQINMEVAKELAAQNSKEPGISQSTQTLDIPDREKVSCRTLGVQTTASSTSNPPSRSGSAQSINGSKKNLKIPNSQSDSSIISKEDVHLLATLRGMRVELAIKEKAVQRLSRDLEECKKTTKKLQAERDKYLNKEKDNKATAVAPKKTYNPMNYTENSDSQALNEAMEKMKVMEGDFRALYEKRLKDLKTLQSSHERELSACHETIKILQSRLEEQASKALKDKRRGPGPIDYYALKAKVTNLERRHSDREKSLHLLIDALSKGQLSNLHSKSSISPDESSSPISCNSPVNKNL